jgi:ABC-type cobalamin transport system permease subunit
MKTLQIVTAVVEAGAGLALTGFPSVTASLLLGMPLDSPAALTLARIGGAAILTLALVCWHNAQSLASRDLIVALLFYNITVAAVLTFARFVDGLHGVLLWPAVVFHLAMAAWCIASLLKKDEAALR